VSSSMCNLLSYIESGFVGVLCVVFVVLALVVGFLLSS